MRIPWYFSVPLCLIVLLTGLYLGSHERDFTSSPSEEENKEKVEAWKATKPSLKDTQLAEPGKAQDIAPAPPVSEPIEEPEPPIVEIPTFDPSSILIETSLTLNQFKNLELSAEDRLSHATYLLSEKKLLAAQLAYERVLDTTKDTTPEQVATAATEISKLQESRTLYRPDPSMRQKLTVNINIDAKLFDQANELKSSIEETLLLASGGLITPKVVIKKAAERPNLPTLSSLSITSGGDKSTPTIRFSTTADAETLIYKAIYNTLRNAALANQDIVPPIAIGDTKRSPKEALPIYVTRYTWLTIIESL